MLNKEGIRELAYLVHIDAIEPIEGSDNCEAAVVGGWKVMVRRNTFTVGEAAIYFEIDSKVDSSNPTFGFLAGKHYAIKTQRYRFGGAGNFCSQGLIMHPSDFGWEIIDKDTIKSPSGLHRVDDESRFLTQELKVTYYIPEDNTRKASSGDKYKIMAQRNGKLFSHQPFRWLMKHTWGRKLLFIFFGKKKDNAKSFPSHLPYIHKSDEERAENMPWILEDKTEWIKTTKIDGTSSLFLLERKRFNRFEYWVCSRNVRQLSRNQVCYHDDNVYWEVNDKYHIYDCLKDLLNKHPEWKYVAIQGETAGVSSSGAPIQGDPHKFEDLRFFTYNFITSDIGRWNSVKGKELLDTYAIPWVPIVDEHYVLPDDFEEFKLSADGPCEAVGASGAREGYVYRNVLDNTKSFKNVSREYLIKH